MLNRGRKDLCEVLSCVVWVRQSAQQSLRSLFPGHGKKKPAMFCSFFSPPTTCPQNAYFIPAHRFLGTSEINRRVIFFFFLYNCINSTSLHRARFLPIEKPVCNKTRLKCWVKVATKFVDASRTQLRYAAIFFGRQLVPYRNVFICLSSKIRGSRLHRVKETHFFKDRLTEPSSAGHETSSQCLSLH